MPPAIAIAAPAPVPAVKLCPVGTLATLSSAMVPLMVNVPVGLNVVVVPLIRNRLEPAAAPAAELLPAPAVTLLPLNEPSPTVRLAPSRTNTAPPNPAPPPPS